MYRHIISFRLIVTLLFCCGAIASWADTDDETLEFALLTDTHGFGNSADIRYAEHNVHSFVNFCNSTPNLAFALFGGDFMNAYETNHDQALWCLKQAQNDFSGLQIPFYATRGNHDCNGKQRKSNRQRDNSQIVTDHEYYELFSPASASNPFYAPEGIVTNPDAPEGNYFFRDFERQRVRLIVLNSYDSDSLEVFGFHIPQLKWLAERALDFSDKADPSDWQMLIAAHSFPSSSTPGSIFHAIMKAYQGHRNYSLTVGSDTIINGAFSRQIPAKIVALLAGHFHEDMYSNADGYNLITTTRGFATGGEVQSDPDSFDHFILDRRTNTLRAERHGRGRSRAFTYDRLAQTYPTLAFPSADGQGAYTTGGRGGRILWVTTLKDSGPGSLRWAVEQKGSRTVVFAVNGYIRLRSPLVIANDSITIAGQTAPGEGIWLRDAPLKITASEVIIRYLHVRPGIRAGRCDAISDGDFGQHNVIIDHVSAGWCKGSAIAFRHVQNATVQRCLLTHTFADDSKTPSPGLLAGGFMVTYYNNIIASHQNAIMIPNEEGCNRWNHIVRNVISNWQDHAIWGGGCQGETTIEENYLIPGPATLSQTLLNVAEDGTGRYYVWGNEMTGQEELTNYNEGMLQDRPGLPYQPSRTKNADREKMHPVARPQAIGFAESCLSIAAFHTKPIISKKTPTETYWELLATAGCSLHRSDYENLGITQLAMRKSGAPGNGLINSEDIVGGFPTIKIGYTPQDSDGDGIPDDWENRHGLDAHSSDDGHILDLSAERTNLELYINDLVGE